MRSRRVKVFGFVFIFLLLGNVLFLMEFNSVHDSKSIAGIYELDYFGITSIFNIKWGHAVNTVEQMSVELANDSTQMIEADIRYHPTIGAVMAHDPVNPDLQYPPFSQWLSLAIRHISNPTSKKIGLKLDFKDFSAVEPCLKELLNHNVLLSHNIPIWINADILQGPHGRQAAIDAFAFVQLCKDYGFVTMPACTLSLGWTTGAPKGEQDVYTDAMVGEMARVCEHFELKRITFPVRAYFVQPSVHSLEFLLNKCKNSTLTVWNTFTEPVDKKLFEWLSGSFKQRKWINLFLATFGKNTFLDVKFADDV